MSDLTPELAAEITAASQTNAEEIAGALGRAFEGEFQLEVGETAPFDTAPSWAGLVVAMKFGEAGMLALLPDVDGVVPQWAHEPDPTGEAKLSTLSQELSMLLVPETLMSEEYRAAWADDLSAAVQRAEALEGAMIQPMEFTRGDTHGVITLVWPVRDALAALGEPAPTGAAEEQVEQTAEPAEQKPQSRVIRTSWPQPRDLRDLPPNTVSALQVAVPLSVSLAGKRMNLEDVIELGPGSIVTFEKSCDDMLEVYVGEKKIASGAAVKVGERFGVRLHEIVMPEEQFRPLLPPQAS